MEPAVSPERLRVDPREAAASMQQQQQSYQQQDATVGAQSAATTAVNIDQPSDQHPFPPQSIATLPPPSYHTESSEGYGGYGDPVTIGKMSAKRFQRAGKFRDPWMALLFLAHFVAFIIISILSFINTPAYTFRPGRRDGDGSVDQGSGGRGAVRLYSYTSVVIMSIITAVPFVLSMIFVVLLHRVPAQAIKLSVIVSLVLVLAASIYFFVKEIWWAGIVMLISALCYAMFWFFARKRIELTTLIVQAVSRVVRAYPGVMFVAIAATVVQTLYTAWWLMTLVAMTGWLRNEERCKDYRDPLTGQVYQSCSNGPATGLGIYLFISLYWTTQVIVNVVHTTISGVFATHYFFGGGFGEMLTTGQFVQPTYSAPVTQSAPASRSTAAGGGVGVNAVPQMVEVDPLGAAAPSSSAGSTVTIPIGPQPPPRAAGQPHADHTLIITQSDPNAAVDFRTADPYTQQSSTINNALARADRAIIETGASAARGAKNIFARGWRRIRRSPEERAALDAVADRSEQTRAALMSEADYNAEQQAQRNAIEQQRESNVQKITRMSNRMGNMVEGAAESAVGVLSRAVRPAGVHPVKRATRGSLNRALTTSFGSVCLGSLVVAIIQLIRALIRSVFSTDGSQPGFCTTVFRCIFDCLLAPIEALALIFNRYAFVTIAIYGTPFVASAKRTWRLLKARGVDGVINDSLVNSLMFLGCVVIAAITAAIGAIMVLVMNPWFNLGGNFTGVFIVLAFAVGGGVAGITTSVVGSGAAALFVCLSEQPEIMAITQPQLFDKIVAAYPAVVSRID